MELAMVAKQQRMFLLKCKTIKGKDKKRSDWTFIELLGGFVVIHSLEKHFITVSVILYF